MRRRNHRDPRAERATVGGGAVKKASDCPGRKERVQTNNYLITKDFDLTVAAVVDLDVPGILERVNLEVEW